MRVLVTVASRHGATWEIGEVIAEVLADRGLDVETRTPEDVVTLDGVDAVVLGSAVYLAHWMPVWPAAVVGAVAFGLAHWYQGTAGVLKTGATGLIMGLLYVASGSILWPAIVHAAVDLQGGAAGRKVLLSPQPASE